MWRSGSSSAYCWLILLCWTCWTSQHAIVAFHPTNCRSSHVQIRTQLEMNGLFSFMQGKTSKAELIASKKQALVQGIAKCPMNGVNTKRDLVIEVDALARELEALNPTVSVSLLVNKITANCVHISG